MNVSEHDESGGICDGLIKTYVQGEVCQGCFSERVIAEKNVEKIGIIKLLHHNRNLHLFVGKYLRFSLFAVSIHNQHFQYNEC